MRKRQFKKVLSLVLALALVFTMNTSVFATSTDNPAPAADPVAEEPAAEENAETPVTNDEKPVEEKKEETPAPAAEETPADTKTADDAAPVEEKKEETTAPAAEETPADKTPEAPKAEAEEEAKGVTQTEEAAKGDLDSNPSGWLASSASDVTSAWDGTTLNVADGESLTLKPVPPVEGQDRKKIKIVVGTGDVTLADGATDELKFENLGLYKVTEGSENNKFTAAAKDDNLTSGTFTIAGIEESDLAFVVNDDNEDTFKRLSVNAAECEAFLSTTLSDPSAIAAALDRTGKETYIECVASGAGNSEIELKTTRQTLYLVDKTTDTVSAVTVPSEPTAPGSDVTDVVTYDAITGKITIPSYNKDREYRLKKNLEDPSGWTTLPAGDSDWLVDLPTETHNGDTVEVEIRFPAVDDYDKGLAFPSGIGYKIFNDITVPDIPDNDVLINGAGEYTVSGIRIVAGDGAKGSIVSNNNIWTVTISSGNAELFDRAWDKHGNYAPVSINVAEKSEFLFCNIGTAVQYSNISVEGKGTVLFDLSYGTKKAFFDSFDSQLSVSSANLDGTKGLVISDNSGKYTTIVGGVDTKKSISTKGKTAIYFADGNTAGPAMLTADLATNTVTVKNTKVYYVLSENKLVKVVGGGTIDLTKANSAAGIYYGKTVFGTLDDSADPATTGFGFKKILPRNTNPVTSIAFYDAMVGDKGASFYVAAPSSLSEKNLNSEFQDKKVVFAISESSAVYTKNLTAYHYVTGTKGSSPDKKYYYSLDYSYLTEGTKLKPNTTYHVFILNTETTGFYSEPAEVGSFTTAAAQSQITLGAATGTIYYGGQGPKKVLYEDEGKKYYADHPDNALEAGNISVTIGTTGYKVEPNYNRHGLDVLDPADSNYKVGEVWTYMFSRSKYYEGTNATKINSAETSDALGVTPDYGMYRYDDGGEWVWRDTLANAVSDNGYFMKSFFVPETGSKYGLGGQISSNVISFNVVAAPVDIQARALKAPVKTYLKSGVVEPDYGEGETTRLAFKNTITEEVTQLTNDDIIVNSSAVYTTNGKRMEEATSTVSYDSAGVYSYQISANTIKPVLTAPGSAMYKINSIGEGKLSIFGEVTTSNFSITPAKVFYGENGDTIKKNMTITYNNGAESAKKIDGSVTGIAFYKTVSADGTISGGSTPISGGPEAQEAGSEFYAQVTVPADKIDAKDAKEVKLVAKITVEKRPISIYLAGEKFSTFRNIDPKPETLSGGKAAGESETTVYVSKEQLGTAENHAYNGPLTTKDILSKNAAFDMSYVDLTVSNNYIVPLTGVELINPQAKNFEVVKANGKYIVKPAWYGYFILEYGGHEGKNSTAKKTIYKQTYYADNGKGKVEWKLPKELETVSAAKTFNGTITDSKDKVAEFEAYPKNSNTSIGSQSVEDFVKNGLALGNNYGDVYFYAIVNAYATEDVYVQTISPKNYSGNKQIVNDGTDKIINGSDKTIQLVVKRDKKGTEADDQPLELGKDYTVSVKNNLNASVKYDSSQSASSNTGEDGAVTQLFKPAKRPQVVITGKGDYKGMKATVYFDILPIGVGNIDNKNAGALQTKTYSDDIALAYNHLRLGKKGGITYKYKVKDDLTIVNSKGNKKKTVTLGSKDYDELLVQANEYPNNAKAVKILGTGSKEAKKAAKAITAPGKNYAVQLRLKGNYYGTITYPINVVSKDVMLLSELAWKASKVSYKAAGVSSDTAKGNFNVKTSKKINKKKLVYGTDFGATIAAYDNGAKMGDGKEVPANLASYAGNYKITIVPLAPLKALASEGKIILDTATVTGTVKGKKLSSKMFTVTGTAGGKSIDKKGKIDYTGANIDDIKIASTKVTEGKQYVALPTSYTSNNENYSGDDVVEKCGESEVYVDYTTGKLQNPDKGEDLNSMAFNNKGVQVNAHTYSYTFNASNAEANYGDTTYGNKRPGTYYIYIKGKGEYAGSYVPVKYTVNGAKLDLKKNANLLSADTCYVNINGAEPGFSLTLPFEVTPVGGDYAGKKTKIVTDKSVAALDDNNDPIYYFTTGKFTGNTKVNDKAGVTITPTTYSGYLTKGVKGNFKIQTKTVSASEILSANEFETGDLGEDLAGKIFVSVEDKYTKAKTPVVKVYQANIVGKKGWKELKKKSDYQFVEILSGGVSNNTINIKDGTSKKPNFKFDDKTIKGSLSPNKVFYDIYSTQGKKWELQLSQNAYFVSGNKPNTKKVDYAFKELNSKQNSGKIVYNGQILVPQIQNLTVDGVQVIVNGKPAKKGVNAKIIMGDNAGKVGTNKYTIVLTKDETGYALGGSKVYKFQIVPQDNKNLVLEK